MVEYQLSILSRTEGRFYNLALSFLNYWWTYKSSSYKGENITGDFCHKTQQLHTCAQSQLQYRTFGIGLRILNWQCSCTLEAHLRYLWHEVDLFPRSGRLFKRRVPAWILPQYSLYDMLADTTFAHCEIIQQTPLTRKIHVFRDCSVCLNISVSSRISLQAKSRTRAFCQTC